ncbi:type II toxin-antitoxin system PemK/MazF family toxin [Bacillus sp. V5-8f]|uniref:type II toxin-antitoxin system PemK/MazF family toxin n=1 Tax=Bacillus sp. V5-8f TaxID=2053044 RepID=UPI000C79209A|nr:type II toxin-antitoxin system PemK/MazF family toxin [Bacillus sp. V5-8f]PLT32536.1 hypothetical protein CUU64_18710 [Bacillus sp. V5-8f]
MEIKQTEMKKKSYIIAEQIRSLGTQHLTKQLNVMDPEDMDNLKDAIIFNLIKSTAELPIPTHLTPEHRRGDIFIARLGPDGDKRDLPVMVITNDVGNHFSPVVTVLPIIHEEHHPLKSCQLKLGHKYSGLVSDGNNTY